MAPPLEKHFDLCETASTRKKSVDCRREYKARNKWECKFKKKKGKIEARGTGKYEDPQYVKILCEQCKYLTIKDLCAKCRKSTNV